MKTIILLTLSASALCACATSGPTTSWGKEGVSMLDYRADGAACGIIAQNATSTGNGSNTAGGINGKNSSDSGAGAPATNTTGPTANNAAGAAIPTGGGGVYRESASPDFVNRAAMQQRSQEMAALRARTDALKSCLVGRGYTEFPLTAEQRKHLATLPEGSAERREYLHKLGTDPGVLARARKTGS